MLSRQRTIIILAHKYSLEWQNIQLRGAKDVNESLWSRFVHSTSTHGTTRVEILTDYLPLALSLLSYMYATAKREHEGHVFL